MMRLYSLAMLLQRGWRQLCDVHMMLRLNLKLQYTSSLENAALRASGSSAVLLCVQLLGAGWKDQLLCCQALKPLSIVLHPKSH